MAYPGAAGLDRRRRAKSLPKLGDLPLHLRDGGDWRRARVQLVGEPVDRDDAICVEQQDRERRALLRPTESDGAVVADHLERAQDAEIEHRADGSRSIATR